MLESWSRGFTDYIDRNGRSWGYFVDVLQNGDKIFGEYSGTVEALVASDGTKTSTYRALRNTPEGLVNTWEFEAFHGPPSSSI